MSNNTKPAPSNCIETHCRTCGARVVSIKPTKPEADAPERIDCDWPPIWVSEDPRGAKTGYKRNGDKITGYTFSVTGQMTERRAAIHGMHLIVTPHECGEEPRR